jgi:B12-binding domain/radical SAM domain protein
MKIAIVSPGLYPYGALVIGGVLKDKGHKVSLFNELDARTISGMDVVGLSLTSTLHLLSTKEFISKLKFGLNPPFIIVGGPVSQAPDLLLSHLPEVDAVVIGEGEETTPELLEILDRGGDLDEVCGIAFKHEDEVIITPQNEPVNLDHRPLPFIPPDLKNQDVRTANTVIETHRGCSGNCTFCLVPKMFKHRIRSRPIDDIVEETRWFMSHGIRRVGMSLSTISQYGWESGLNESNFTRLLKEVSEVIGPMNLASPDIRVDMVSEDILRAIKDYTAGYVVFGIESGSDRLLSRMRKGITVDDIIEAVNLARKVGLRVSGSFITGYPGETDEDHEKTVDLIGELMLDDVWVNTVSPIPGTKLAEEIVKLPIKENPAFIKAENDIGRLHDLTVAESRSLDLLLTFATAAPIPIPLTDKVYSTYLKGIKAQTEEVVLCTNMIRNFYSRIT